jgi:hypothetical protein
MALFAGSAAGHIPQLHLPPTHVQSEVPYVQVVPLPMQAEPFAGSFPGHAVQCQLGPIIPPPQMHWVAP